MAINFKFIEFSVHHYFQITEKKEFTYHTPKRFECILSAMAKENFSPALITDQVRVHALVVMVNTFFFKNNQ